MSKKFKATKVDFDFGAAEIIPSTQEAYHNDSFDENVRKIEKEALTAFKTRIASGLWRPHKWRRLIRAPLD